LSNDLTEEKIYVIIVSEIKNLSILFMSETPLNQSIEQSKIYSPETLAEYENYAASIQIIIDLLNNNEMNLSVLNDSQLQTIAKIANLTLNRKEGTVFVHDGNNNSNANEALPILPALHSAKSIETFVANKTKLLHVEQRRSEIARQICFNKN
jgi:hypothetical protein